MQCQPIFTIFTPLERELNFQQNLCDISHLTLTLDPHSVLGKRFLWTSVGNHEKTAATFAMK